MIRSAALVCAVVALVPASFASAQATDDDRARTHFDAGLLHYEEGAYDRALVEFERAWELSHRPELLLNLATVRERLAQYERAAGHLQEYLRLRPGDPQGARYRRRISNLERFAREGPDTAPVDDDEDDDSPLPSTPPTSSASGGGGISPVGPILLGVGGAAVVAAAIVGGVAIGDNDAVRSMCMGSVCPAELRDDADGVETLAVVTDVLWIAGAVLAATGLVLTIVLTDGGDDGSAASAVRLRAGLSGVGLEGSF